jgi:hypothetical protein
MSDPVDRDAFTRTYLYLLDEIVGDPPKDAPGNAVLDDDAGWLHTLLQVDHTRASKTIAQGGTTIAGQASHAAYYVELLEQLAQGANVEADWPKSFVPSVVDEARWEETRARLLAALTRFRAMVLSVDDWDDERLRGALGVLVHTAYHLGAVRQMIRVV